MITKRIGLLFARLLSKLIKNHEITIKYYRKIGNVSIGSNCLICSSLLTRESKLISIGNNVTISSNVKFVTHDNSIKLVYPDKSDLFGKIRIGNNCFIGENSLIMYGVSIPDYTIVAAGSVVTKSIKQSNKIIAGNPAKVIGDWKTYKEKYRNKAITRNELYKRLAKDDSFLVRRPFID